MASNRADVSELGNLFKYDNNKLVRYDEVWSSN